MCVPAYSIAEALGRSIDHRLKVITSLQNQDGPRSTDICGHLAEFIDAASRTVQIGLVYRNSIYAIPVAIDGELNASLDASQLDGRLLPERAQR